MIRGRDQLWCKVVEARYNGIFYGIQDVEVKRSFSSWWQGITGSFTSCNEARPVVMEAVKICLGRGDLTWFCEDIWAGISSLLDSFPRLYAVSLDKGKQVAKLGFWVNNKWFWCLNWRRPLLERREFVRAKLIWHISEVHLVSGRGDQVFWSFERATSFSTRSLMRDFVH